MDLDAGLRWEKLLEVKWEDLDLECGDLRVRRQIACIDEEVVETPPKNEKRLPHSGAGKECDRRSEATKKERSRS